MTLEINKFFTIEGNLNLISSLASNLNCVDQTKEVQRTLSHVREVLGSMETNKEDWEKNCQLSIDDHGEKFKSTLVEIKSNGESNTTKNNIERLASYCYLFLIELDLSCSDYLSDTLLFARQDFEEIALNSKGQLSQDIAWAKKSYPIRLTKKLLNCRAAKSLININYSVEKLEEEHSKFNSKSLETRSQFESEYNLKLEKIDELKTSLNNVLKGYNFVGLYDGFNSLSESKRDELKSNSKWLWVLGGLAVTPILIELIIIISNLSQLSKLADAILLSFLPILTITGLLIYFFRVILHNYKSIESQLLQIELRKTLCQFIQSYADYAVDIKEKDSEALTKFENLIFSGIVSAEESLPSTYDGVEQLGKLVASIKGK